MATVSIKQNVVVVKDPAKCEEIRNALSSDKKAFTDIKPTSCQLTQEQHEFIKKCFCHSDK